MKTAKRHPSAKTLLSHSWRPSRHRDSAISWRTTGFYAEALRAHLPALSTRVGIGTLLRSSVAVRFVQGGVENTFRCVTADRLFECIYKPETVSLIESVNAGSVHLIGQPNGSVRSIALTKPRDLTAEQLALLCDLLLDDNSYFFARKRCIPKPTARFRLDGDDGYLTVTVGFACSGWIIQSPYDRAGSFFDPVRESVLALVKQLFPEYASPNSGSVWRAGVINALIDAATESPT